MDKVTTIAEQTIFDIAIQQYGGVEGAVNLVLDNFALGLNFNSNIQPGDKLKLTDGLSHNEEVSRFYTKKQLLVATKSGGDVAINEGDFSNDFNCDFAGGICNTLGAYSSAYSKAYK